MTSSICSECGATKASQDEANLSIPATTHWTLMRCQQLAKSNEPPGCAEKAYLRAVHSEAATRLTSLEDEITRIRDRLEHLEAEREELSVYHSQNVAILSPLRRMPPEVLAEIFLCTLPTMDEVSLLPTRAIARGSPWVLAQVSRTWRAVALSTPSLWSLVYISRTQIPDVSLEMIETQIERARMLKIHFYASEEMDEITQSEIFDTLCEHSSRWEELSIQLTKALVAPLAALRGRLPSLQRLWIQWSRIESQNGVESITCFETASSLMDAGMYSKSRYVPVLLPAHQLTSYRLQGPWKMHRHVLRMAPNIVDARIIVAFDEEPWPESAHSVIDMPHVRRLYVSDTKILEYLRAPALVDIAIYLTGPKALVERLDAFVLRSACTLQRLCLKGLPHARTTAEILDKFPSITGLMLVFCCRGSKAVDTHLTALTLSGSSPPTVATRLTEIFFGSSKPIAIDYPLFLKMLESRRSPHSALTAAAFLMYDRSEPDPVTLAGLDALRDGGLSLSVASGPSARRRIKHWTGGTPWH